MTKTRPFLSTCYGYPSTTEVPPCCQAATKKLTFSTTSVLLLLNVPLSLSRGTVFRRQKNARRGYRPKIAGILFVCNEPEGKYYTVPGCLRALSIMGRKLPGCPTSRINKLLASLLVIYSSTYKCFRTLVKVGNIMPCLVLKIL